MSDVHPLYANVVRATIGPFDITLDFGYKSPERMRTEEYDLVARITMSLPHTKSMVQILQGLIAQYEQQVGPISLPPSPAEEGK